MRVHGCALLGRFARLRRALTQPRSAVVLPRAMALRRVAVHSSARTVELFTSASGGAQTWQYVSSERGAPDGADGFRVEYAAAELDCVCGACPPRALACAAAAADACTAHNADALKLRLLSLRPPGTLSLRGVVLDAVPATVAPPAAPMAALMSAMQAGGAAQPGPAAALMGMLGALAGAARPAQPAELTQAHRSAAAAPEVAAATARVQAVEVAVGEAAEDAEPQAEPLAALELRITRLEARVERGLADIAERVRRLEQGQAAAERPP